MLKTQLTKSKKTVSILLLSTLLITTLSACSQNSEKISEDKPKQEQEVKVEAEKQAGAENETRIIKDMGTIEPDWIKGADETQERLGIPTIMVDGTFENSDKTYDFLGELIGSQERAKELTDYFRESIKETKDIVSKIPEDKKVKVYYAGGDGGLSTSPAGSIHSELIDIVGGKNVVGTEGPGNMEVTMEQILNWNPEKIILEKEGAMGRNGSESLYEDVLKDDTWKSVEAVKTGEVYQIPNAPFNWYGRPQSPSRILGTKWLGNLLYPDYFKVDINKETKEFYKKFYNIDLKDSDVDEILTNARPKN